MACKRRGTKTESRTGVGWKGIDPGEHRFEGLGRAMGMRQSCNTLGFENCWPDPCSTSGRR